MKKKIFITGASGFVGSHLVEAAQKLGLEVHASIRSQSNRSEIQPFVDQFVYPNLGDFDELKALFEKNQYHYIIHAAALTRAKNNLDFQKVNVKYTEAIMQAGFSAHMPLERIIFVSSLAAIGSIDYNNPRLIDETFPYNPHTMYGKSKMEAELMIRQKFNNHPISVFRPTAVYGPREKDIFILLDTLNKGFEPYIGKKPQKLSFIYVKDLVDVLLKGCTTPQEGLQFYNISDGEVYSRYEMADVFKSVMRKKLFKMHIPYRVVKILAEILQSVYKPSSKTPVIYPERLQELTAENWGCDITLAKNTLGFNPQYLLKEGLQESLLWYKDNNWL